MSLMLSNSMRASRFPATILSQLGVEFSSKRGFWLHNESRLEFIFHDFRVGRRAWAKDNHPDRGGDPVRYAHFNAACDMLERSFQRHGVGPQQSPVARAAEAERQVIWERWLRSRPEARQAARQKSNLHYKKHRAEISQKAKDRRVKLRALGVATMAAMLFLWAPLATAGTTKKPFHLEWDPNTDTVLFYTVYEHRILIGDYLPIGTVLYPAPTRWTLPTGTTRLTLYAVSASNSYGESERSNDCVLKNP